MTSNNFLARHLRKRQPTIFVADQKNKLFVLGHSEEEKISSDSYFLIGEHQRNK